MKSEDWERTDLGRLDERVTNLDKSFKSFQDSVSASIAALGDKIDRQAAKPTDWLKFGGVMTGVFVVILGIATYVKSGIDTDIARVERANNDEAKERKQSDKDINTLMQPILAATAQQVSNQKAVDTLNASVEKRFEVDEQTIQALAASTWSKGAQVEYEKRIDEKIEIYQDFAKRDLARVEGHVDTVDANQIKRPEISSLFSNDNERISALSTRLNELGKTLADMSPTWSDIIQDLQTQLREMRQNQGQTPAIAPIAPLTPLGPLLQKAPQ